MISRTVTAFGSCPSATTRNTSRSVRIPLSLPESITRIDPVWFWRIFAEASATVSSGESDTHAAVMMSETFIVSRILNCGDETWTGPPALRHEPCRTTAFLARACIGCTEGRASGLRFAVGVRSLLPRLGQVRRPRNNPGGVRVLDNDERAGRRYGASAHRIHGALQRLP